ncbi:MAG: hypothetical protein PHX14_04950 [Syntrophomonadaceae bacterium]|nr:hypothetical protein [Syntrophomonadaceae bacterium]
MNDTSSAIQRKMLEMMQEKSEVERLFMGASMFDTARSITRAAILEAKPDISPAEFRAEFFQRWYGEDFEPCKSKKIIAALLQKP